MAGASKVKKPPKKKTTQKTNDDTASYENKRKEELEAKIRRRVALEEKAFRIVESFLDGGVEQEDIKDAALYIDPSHYADIVEERSITKLCGYPLCVNSLTNVPSQKYHISTKNNKVYDITERKKFCSGGCYQASQSYEKQLSSTPVWLRDQDWEPPHVTLLNTAEASPRGGSGEEVITHPAAEIKEEVEKIEKSSPEKVDASPEPSMEEESNCLSPGNSEEETPTEVSNEVTSVEDEETREKVTEGTAQEEESVVNRKERDDGERLNDLPEGENSGEQTSATSGDEEETESQSNEERFVPKPALKGSHPLDGEKRLKKRVSISEIPVQFSEVPFRGTLSPSSSGILRHSSISEEDESVNNQAITAMLKEKVLKRRLSLKEAPTPEVFTEGEATTLQAAAAFFQKNGSIGEVTDVTSVREVMLLDSDDDEDGKNSNDEDGEKESQDDGPPPHMQGRRKSISEAAAMVNKLSSSCSLPMGINPNLPGLEGLGGSRPSICGIGPNKRRSISEAALSAGRKKSTCSQIKGVKSLKEMLKAEINTIERDECLSITDQLEQRVRDRRKSLSEPPTPDIFTKGMATTHDAMQVGAQKRGSVGEMHSTLHQVERRIGKYRAILDNNDYEVDQFGKYHSRDTSQSVRSKSKLLSEIMDKKNDLRSVLDTAKENRRIQAAKKAAEDEDEVWDCNPIADNDSQGSGEVSDDFNPACEGQKGQRTEDRKMSKLSIDEVMKNVQKLQLSRQSAAKPSVSQKKAKVRSKASAMQLIQSSLYNWKTNSSAKFLKAIDSSATEVEKKDSFNQKYRELCRKVDNNELEVTDDLENPLDMAKKDSQAMPALKALQEDTAKYDLQVKEFYGVKRKEETAGSIDGSSSESKEVVLPYIDSHSQMATRRRIVLDKVNKAMSELLLPLQLSVIEATADLRKLVHTFKFTNKNIVLRPAEWTLLSYVLLRLLALRNPRIEEGFKGSYATHYFQALTLSAGLTESNVQTVIEYMTRETVTDV